MIMSIKESNSGKIPKNFLPIGSPVTPKEIKYSPDICNSITDRKK